LANPALPVDPFLDHIVDELRRARAVVVTAAPGAGKTTRVPPALVPQGPVILLQPRRVAARTIAARIASECSWTLGREVGWQIRFDRNYSSDTRLLVVTEGILTARLQTDPLLADFRTIVLDEFHERSIHADVAIALARQAWRARDDLRLVVMSATLDSAAVSAFLDDCPIVDVPGRLHPLDISYAPGESIGDAVQRVINATPGPTPGNVLCFLPGAAEIRRAIDEISQRTGRPDLLPLHGSLPSEDQDRALRPSDRQRVIVATNIAETSLTVPGVTAVVDTGLHKVARYDPDRGIDSLETERITADAAAQRAGRAGREAAGVVRRLWDARDRLRPHREPDVERVDLSSTVLDIIAWGGDPRSFEWFEPPPVDALESAIVLLERLELISNNRLTAAGEQVRHLPLHPRLARMIVTSGGARDIVRACALLSERHFVPMGTATTPSDLLSALDNWPEVPHHVRRVADQIISQSAARPSTEADFLRAVLSGYPDRVARRRELGSPEFLLASGAGARLARESGVRSAEFIVALDVRSSAAGPRNPLAIEPLIRMASSVERDWLQPTSSETIHQFDAATGRVRAARVDRYGAIVLREQQIAVDPAVAARLLAGAWIERHRQEARQGVNVQLLHRLRFAGQGVDVGELAQAAAYGARSIDDIDLAGALPPTLLRDLERDAPSKLLVPSGRSHALDYDDDGGVSLSVKLQELFGLRETPRIGKNRVPVRLALLAPNGRPVQVTQDLQSFWERTYPEVRRELRGRYPKHPWPEDPWSARPTALTRRK
jgi:ATP-dependent helicase HrpB